MLEACGVQVRGGGHEGSLGGADGDRGGADLEPGQHDAHHDVEALARLAGEVGVADLDALEAHGRAGVAAQGQAVEAAGHAQAARARGDQVERRLDRRRGVGRKRRHDVRIRLARRGHERLLGAELARGTRTARLLRHRRPEVAARALLREGERGQVLARRDLAQDALVLAARGDHLGARDVHQVHHRGRAAGARDGLDHRGEHPRSLAQAAVLGVDGQAEEAGRAERLQLRARERGVAIGGRGGGRDGLLDDRVELVEEGEGSVVESVELTHGRLLPRVT